MPELLSFIQGIRSEIDATPNQDSPLTLEETSAQF